MSSRDVDSGREKCNSCVCCSREPIIGSHSVNSSINQLFLDAVQSLVSFPFYIWLSRSHYVTALPSRTAEFLREFYLVLVFPIFCIDKGMNRMTIFRREDQLSFLVLSHKKGCHL